MKKQLCLKSSRQNNPFGRLFDWKDVYKRQLPEVQNDFIFAIVCEELGFVGACLIIVLFALLIWRGYTIALHAKDRFGMLIAVGITTQIGMQVMLNIAVVTNTIPNTGISLPMFSYGGTSLLSLIHISPPMRRYRHCRAALPKGNRDR